MTEGDQRQAWSTKDLDAYLRDRYVTIESLAAETGLDTETLEELIETGCMPGPSYVRRERDELFAHVNGDPDTLSVRTVERHFAKDVIAWVKQIQPRLKEMAPETLAPILKSELRDAFRRGLEAHGAVDIGYRGIITPDGGIDENSIADHFEDHIWHNWRKGTWGICVYGSEDMFNVARKTIAVQRLKLLTQDGTKQTYTPDEARDVRAALAEYEAIVPPFSPHDYDQTSRAHLVDAVRDIVGYDPADVQFRAAGEYA